MPKKKKRITPAPEIKTREAFDATVNHLCESQLRLETRLNLRDRLINEIRKDHDEVIEALTAEIQGKLAACAKYATDHRELLFPGSVKSAATSLGRYGFSFGKPALATKPKTKWGDVIAKLKELGKNALIKTKEAPDKEAIKKLTEVEMDEIGVRLKKLEAFFIEPKRDNPDRIQSA